MSVIAVVSFAGGVVFYIVGAWPVGFFFGLDAVLIYVAFRVNYRAADAYEEVTVTPSELRVRKVTHQGKVSEWSLNPVWVRLERETHEEFGLMRLLLVVARPEARGRELSGSERKGKFRGALATAIGEAKRGPTRNLDPRNRVVRRTVQT